MTARQIVAASLVTALVGSIPMCALAGQQGVTVPQDTAGQNVTLAGTAKNEARKPYPDYQARAREVQQGQVLGTTSLDKDGRFTLSGLRSTNLIVELVDRRRRVVCTEGPFDMTQLPAKHDVVIDCDKVPAAWWLLAAAAAAGVTSGVVTAPPASPAR